MKDNPRAQRINITLRGGPAHGREYTIDPDLNRYGKLRVPVERQTTADWLNDPFEITTIAFDVAVYERSRVPGRWTFARMEGKR